MKTGFTCAAGFNLVASATHGGRRLIVVVLGSPTPRERTAKAIALFERGFAQSGGGLVGLFGGGGGGQGLVDALPSPGVGAAPDMHGEICSARGRAAALAAEEEDMRAAAPAVVAGGRNGGARGLTLFAAMAPTTSDPVAMAAMPAPHFDPVPVFVGPKPGWTGPVAAARPTPFAAPESASAYAASAEKSPAQGAEESALPTTAPIALKSAVHVPTKLAPPRGRHKAFAKKASETKPIKKVAIIAPPNKPAPHPVATGKSGKPPASP
jgi:D-alanyl-D-alanine carboxypeptidase